MLSMCRDCAFRASHVAGTMQVRHLLLGQAVFYMVCGCICAIAIADTSLRRPEFRDRIRHSGQLFGSNLCSTHWQHSLTHMCVLTRHFRHATSCEIPLIRCQLGPSLFWLCIAYGANCAERKMPIQSYAYGLSAKLARGPHHFSMVFTGTALA
jgi:hypothetical protein